MVWAFRAINHHGCFSPIGSSAQRLPNGNTFICSDTEGHFFEVTANGELAWEYINPVTRDGPVKIIGDVLPMTNSAFRAFRYPPDHPAFQGLDLKPQGTITERAAQGIDVYRKRPQPGSDRPGDNNRQGKRGPGGGGPRGNPDNQNSPIP